MDKQKHLDDLFRRAKEQNPVVTFGETKERFLTSSQTDNLNTKAKNGSNFLTKKLIIMLAALSTIIIGLFMVNNHFETVSSQHEIVHTISKKDGIEVTLRNGNIQKVNLPFKNFETLPIYKELFSVENNKSFYIPIAIPDSSKPIKFVELAEPRGTLITDEYIFPKLTDAEIKANHKQKREMLKDLEKFDKKEYAYIPTGTFNYEEKQVSLQSFYMKKKEVTNLEYRTFLFDLLIQNRKDEFIIAKPDQSQWTKMFGSNCTPMEENYFSHEAYNKYPVCNVSREAVELYCKWLTQELVKVVDPKKREIYNDIRIPGRVEWVFAASNEGKTLPYPWGGPFLRNHEGCYLANFKPLPENYHDDGGYFTVKVDSYLSNEFGLFNMSGNVSEMVYNAPNSRKEPGTAGGGWMNDGEELKILGADPYEGIIEAHPNIGFRVVMTVKK